MKYFFALGAHSKLSIAEIAAVLRRKRFDFERIFTDDSMLIINCAAELEPTIINELGGTIKFGEILSAVKQVTPENLFSLLKPTDKKFYFGLSAYGCKLKLLRLGLEIKKLFKQQQISCRYVTSKENPLSSVVIAKNNLAKENGAEIVIIKHGANYLLGQTVSVQDFENYSKLDFGRPARDDLSGMLPPKIAQIMINLAGQASSANILDPFCGSGTTLQMAALLGYKSLIGFDKSAKAIDDSRTNFDWLKHNFKLKSTLTLKKMGVENLSQEIKAASIDAIVTEPYLGPALRGSESTEQIKKNIAELKRLYQTMLHEFTRALKSSGKVVVIIPEFQLRRQTFSFNLPELLPRSLKIDNEFTYSRPGQKVLRHIYVLRK